MPGLLLLLAVTSLASPPPPVPGDCSPSPRHDGGQGLELTCHLSAINSDQVMMMMMMMMMKMIIMMMIIRRRPTSAWSRRSTR